MPVVLDLCGVSPDLPLESLRRADVVIVDADTAEMLTGTLPSGEQSGLRVSGELERRIHTRYTVLMLSDTKGIFLSDNKYHEMLLPFDVSEVDRSGADDSFISALTYDYATRVKDAISVMPAPMRHLPRHGRARQRGLSPRFRQTLICVRLQRRIMSDSSFTIDGDV